MPSRWLEWTPALDTFDTRDLGENPIIHARGSDTSETPHIKGNPIINDSQGRNDPREPRVIEKTHIPSVSKVSKVPPMPPGVRLIRWEPKPAPVAIDVCSVVVDVPKFVESELRDLDSRLNNPWTIHGGFTVPQLLDRLAQVGVLVVLEPCGTSNAMG
jgi:hypothetical protein